MLFDAGRNSTPTGGVNPDKIDNAIAEYAWWFKKIFFDYDAQTQLSTLSTDWTLTLTFSIAWSCGSKTSGER